MKPVADKIEFLVYAPNKWDDQWMNRQQLFSRIGKQHHVVYSNGPWMTYNRSNPDYKKASLFGIIIKKENVTLNFSPKLLLLRKVHNSLYAKLMGKLYNKYINQFFGSPKTKILYLFHPTYNFLRHHIDHEFCVYHAYDDFSKQDYYTDKIKEDEIELCNKADLIFASSRLIADRLKKISPKDNVFFIPNGVDFNLFSHYSNTIPDDLIDIPEPRLGYVGRLNQKFDFDLIEKLSQTYPNYSFVLVGEVANLDKTNTDIHKNLLKRENVYFLGNKPHASLPEYMNRMDVNLMCYKISNDLWSSNGYPLKMHEYLATGKPIISADLDAVREFSDVIPIATNLTQWEDYINTAIANDNTETAITERTKTAQLNTWDQRVKIILTKIQQLYE